MVRLPAGSGAGRFPGPDSNIYRNGISWDPFVLFWL